MGLAYIEGAVGGGVRSSDVTASAADILTGKYDLTAQSDDEVVQGTMPNNGTVNHSLPINGSFTIAKGYHSGSGKVSQSVTTKAAATYYATTSDQTIAANQWLSGAQTIKKLTQTNLSGGNIKPGVTVKVNNGNTDVFSVTGSMASKGAATYYPTTSDQTISAGQYLSGNQVIKAVSQQNLVAGNIKKGVTVYVKNGSGNIFAVTGTWEGYVTNTSSPYNRGVWLSGWNIAGCAKPSGAGFFYENPLSYIQYNATSFRVTASKSLNNTGWFFYLPYKPMNGINNINISYIGTWRVSSSYPMVLGVTAQKPPNGISGSEETQTSYSSFTKYTTSATMSSTQETTLTVNISGINTNQYIIFGPVFYGNYGNYMDITRIWFS